MLSCKEVTRLLSEAQDRKLTFSERAGLKVHRLICSACNNFGKQMNTLSLISKQYAKNEHIDEYLEKAKADSDSVESDSK